MGKLSAGLENLLKEQRLHPEPKHQPLEKPESIANQTPMDIDVITKGEATKVKVSYLRGRRKLKGKEK